MTWLCKPQVEPAAQVVLPAAADQALLPAMGLVVWVAAAAEPAEPVEPAVLAELPPPVVMQGPSLYLPKTDCPLAVICWPTVEPEAMAATVEPAAMVATALTVVADWSQATAVPAELALRPPAAPWAAQAGQVVRSP